MDWLLAPIDPSRSHLVDFATAWHGRSMVLAWGFIAPLAILMARFFKILPGQDWPRELDTQLWWRSHWMGQAVAVVLTVVGVGLIFAQAEDTKLHGVLGYAVLTSALVQVGLGMFRGTKGGPTAPAEDGSLRGDHYDMTPWRVMFEWLHKSFGYFTLALAALTIVLGMWDANAPRWMWVSLALWWGALLGVAVLLQRRGFARDTYQAIWGPDNIHPGNRRKPIGWGIARERPTEGRHVRSD